MPMIVATDSQEISNIIKNKGGQVFISKKEHFCGSDMCLVFFAKSCWS